MDSIFFVAEVAAGKHVTYTLWLPLIFPMCLVAEVSSGKHVSYVLWQLLVYPMGLVAEVAAETYHVPVLCPICLPQGLGCQGCCFEIYLVIWSIYTSTHVLDCQSC